MSKLHFFILFCVALLFAQKPTDVDSLFKGKEYLPKLNPSLRSSFKSTDQIPVNAVKDEKDGALYVLQFEAVADFDAAQRRKAQISASTGYEIQIVFDTPFYKLRGGSFSSKAAAEDKARELLVYNINALVIRLR